MLFLQAAVHSNLNYNKTTGAGRAKQSDLMTLTTMIITTITCRFLTVCVWVSMVTWWVSRWMGDVA